MLFDQETIDSFTDVVGWSDHYNTATIPALPPALSKSESALFVQDAHPMVNLANIQVLLPSDYLLHSYLSDIRKAAIVEVLNKVSLENSIQGTGKDLVTSKVIHLERLPHLPITNESRFVGIRFTLGRSTGIRLQLERIGLYLTEAQPTLTLYLFNSNQPVAVNTYIYTSAVANSFEWLESQILIDLDSGDNNTGATWYLGYYQDDLQGSAIRYDPLNWNSGYCGGCGDKYKNVGADYKSVSKHVKMCPFYIAATNLPVDRLDRFELEDLVATPEINYGFNLDLIVKCHLGRFWAKNRLNFARAIQKTCALKVLQGYLSSNESSGAEQNIQRNTFLVVNGDATTKQRPYSSQVDTEIKAIRLDLGSQHSNPCIPCTRRGARLRAF